MIAASRFPRFGLGTSPLGNRRATLTEAEAGAVIGRIAAAGPALFDTAPLYGYGLAERRLGRALHGVADATVMTKVGRRLVPLAQGGTAHPGYLGESEIGSVFDYGRDAALASFRESAARLGGRRISILLIHDLGAIAHGARADLAFEEALEGAWRTLQQLKAAGEIDRIGLAVTEWEVCDAWLDRADPDVFLIAARMTLLRDDVPSAFLERCVARRIDVVIAAPFASGLLAAPRAGAFHNYRPAGDATVAAAERLERLCLDHGVTLLAAALHYPLTRPGVAAVVAGARTADQADMLAEAMRTPPPAELWPAVAAAADLSNRSLTA